MKSFNVFVLPSTQPDPFPTVILEAMAAGVPVVAEKRGGIPEIVVSGENGLLARSLDEIGDHLRRLREDPTLCEHLGRGARATAERFSLKRQIAAYRDLLADIQRERAVPSRPAA